MRPSCPNAPDAVALGVNDKTIPHHDVVVGVLLERPAYSLHCPRQQHVVRVQKPEDVARGSLKAFVQAVGGSLIGFENYARQAVAKALDQFTAAVR